MANPSNTTASDVGSVRSGWGLFTNWFGSPPPMAAVAAATEAAAAPALAAAAEAAPTAATLDVVVSIPPDTLPRPETPPAASGSGGSFAAGAAATPEPTATSTCIETSVDEARAIYAQAKESLAALLGTLPEDFPAAVGSGDEETKQAAIDAAYLLNDARFLRFFASTDWPASLCLSAPTSWPKPISDEEWATSSYIQTGTIPTTAREIRELASQLRSMAGPWQTATELVIVLDPGQPLTLPTGLDAFCPNLCKLRAVASVIVPFDAPLFKEISLANVAIPSAFPPTLECFNYSSDRPLSDREIAPLFDLPALRVLSLKASSLPPTMPGGVSARSITHLTLEKIHDPMAFFASANPPESLRYLNISTIDERMHDFSCLPKAWQGIGTTIINGVDHTYERPPLWINPSFRTVTAK